MALKYIYPVILISLCTQAYAQSSECKQVGENLNLYHISDKSIPIMVNEHGWTNAVKGDFYSLEEGEDLKIYHISDKSIPIMAVSYTHLTLPTIYSV